MADERAALSTPKVDPTDVVAALQRWEARTNLKGVDLSERMRVLLQDRDPILLAAALEGRPEWSGLTAEMQEDVKRAYVEKHHAPKIRTLNELQEALDVCGAAAEIATMKVRNDVGMAPDEFDKWFATAGEGDKARAA